MPYLASTTERTYRVSFSGALEVTIDTAIVGDHLTDDELEFVVREVALEDLANLDPGEHGTHVDVGEVEPIR